MLYLNHSIFFWIICIYGLFWENSGDMQEKIIFIGSIPLMNRLGAK